MFNRRPKPQYDQPREDCRYYVMNKGGSRVIWIADYNQSTDLFVSPYGTRPPLLHSEVTISVLEPGEQRDPVLLSDKAQAYQKLVAQLRAR